MKYILLALLLSPVCAFSQVITTYAGNGTAAFSGDGGAATAAAIHRPISCVKDLSGNLVVCDFENNRIRRIDASGIIETIAGTTVGYSGDGGAATAAKLHGPEKITLDGSGNIYFCDFFNNVVRKIDPAGIITTIAGTGTAGYTGDGGPATAATFRYPSGVAVDGSNNIYIADQWNNRIRKIDATGVITTYAGNGPTGFMSGGYGGDGGQATAAQINFPVAITVTPSGDIVFSDCGNHRVRRISPLGIITAVAGTGVTGSAGDGSPATAAEVNFPEGVSPDVLGNLFICEKDGHRVRRIDAATGIITTVAGTGTGGFSGDGGAATAATIMSPEGVYVDQNSGCVYISDSYNNRIRKACVGAPPSTTSVGGQSAKTGFRVYPNPADGDISVLITAPGTAVAEVVVRDVTGREMSRTSITANRAVILQARLLPGVYYIEAATGVDRYVERLVVIP